MHPLGSTGGLRGQSLARAPLAPSTVSGAKVAWGRAGSPDGHMAVFCNAAAGMPVGVVPAVVLGVSSHPAWWAAYTTTRQNPAATAAAYTSAQLA
jgi:hypothetical protein